MRNERYKMGTRGIRQKRIWFKLIVLALVLGLALLLSGADIACGASASADPDHSGSIRVQMKDQEADRVVTGGTVSLYHVGIAAGSEGSYTFRLTDEFANSGVSLKDVRDPDLAQALAAYVKKENQSGDKKLSCVIKTVEKDGTAVFSNLEKGLYLIVQEQAAAGYYAINGFLVSIPMWEGGRYVYDIKAEPKLEDTDQPGPNPPMPPGPNNPDNPDNPNPPDRPDLPGRPTLPDGFSPPDRRGLPGDDYFMDSPDPLKLKDMSNQSEGGAPKTGDSYHLELWIVIALISLWGMTALWYFVRRRRSDR